MKQNRNKTPKIRENSIAIIEENNHKTILKNNLTVLSEQIPSLQSFALGIFIKAGSIKDPIGKDGLAHIIEHLAFKKTLKKNSYQIASAFESLGAYFNAFTSKDYICFYARSLTKHFDKILELLWEIVFQPDFNKENLNKEKKIIEEEILSFEDDYEDMIFDLADSILFETDEYSHQIIGNKETLKKIYLKDIQNFHKQYFNSNNCIISYVGNQNHQSIIENINNLNIKNKDKKNGKLHLEFKKENKINTIEIKKPTQLVHLLISVHISDYDKNDRFSLYIINSILGDGMSSRLNRQLREKHGLVYNVYSSIQLFSKQGAFYIYTEVNKDDYKKAEKLIDNEIGKIITNGIRKKELQKAKEQIKTSLILESENISERMESLVKDELSSSKFETQKELFETIDKINKNQIQFIFKRFFTKNNLKKVIIYPE